MAATVFFALLLTLSVHGQNWSTRPNNPVIAAGTTVTIDTDITLTSELTVLGTLQCANKDLQITVPRIIVKGNGKFICGTEANRFTNKLTITLTGARSNDASIFQSKCIGATDNAVVELHGENRAVTWTQLGATADKGATQITLKEAVDWRVGEVIVLATTDFSMEQAETRTITAVDASKKVLTLNTALSFMHFGVLQQFKGNSLTLDERGEVGLLTRNIVIKGDDQTAAASRHGGHIIITGTAQGRLDGIEVTKAGMETTLGRYPIHFHLRGDASASYVRKNSVHHTFNRCVTVHGTDKLMVRDNVCFESTGHGYFVEDGFEQYNEFIHNLGLNTRRAKSISVATLPTDWTTVSTFWITNPNNKWQFNAAAGSDFAGFWFALPNKPLEFGANVDLAPNRQKLLLFDDNRGHSALHSNLAIDGQPSAADASLIGGHYAPYNDNKTPASGKFVPIIRRFTSFKSRDRSVWMRANTMRFENCVYADNGLSSLFAFNQIQTNALYVGISANIGTPSTPLEFAAQMSLPYSTRNSLAVTQFIGHAIYDGPTFTLSTHFANFNKPWASAFQAVGAAVKSPVHVSRALTWEATPHAQRVSFDQSADHGTIWSSGIIDRDGTLSGKAGTTVVARPAPHTRHEWTQDSCFSSVDGACQDRPDWNAVVCDGIRYGHVFLNNYYPHDNQDNDDIGITRSDGRLAAFDRALGTFGGDQLAVVVNKNLRYRFTYARIPGRVQVRFTFANPGESITLEFPNWPTLAQVNNAAKVDTPAQLAASSGNSYLQHNNNVWVRLVAARVNTGYEDEGGADHYPGSSTVVLCVNAGCGAQPLRHVARLADFESGVDVHAGVAAQPGLTVTPLLSAWTPAPYDSQEAKDDINYYDITSAALNKRAYTDFVLTFEKQNWQVYRALQIKATGGCLNNAPCKPAQWEVHIRINQPNRPHAFLGKGSGEFELNLPTDVNSVGTVDQVIVRMYNDEFLSALSGTATFRTHLFYIHLAHFDSVVQAHPRTTPLPFEPQCASATQTFMAVPATPPPTPLPKAVGFPIGNFDGASPTRMNGWACDENLAGKPTSLHIYVGGPAGQGQFHTAIVANQPRADVTKVYPNDCPGDHGFTYYFDKGTIPAAWSQSPVSIYVYVIGVGVDGKNDGLNPLIGTKTTKIQPLANPPKVTPRPTAANPTPAPAPVARQPVGAVTRLDESAVEGWACDADEPSAAVTVRVYFGALLYTEVPADKTRSDLGQQSACQGTAHGFVIEWKGSKVLASYETTPVVVKVVAVNLGTATTNPTIGVPKSLTLVRVDKPSAPAPTPDNGSAPTPAPVTCPAGSAGCACDAGKCDSNGFAALECKNDSCVLAAGCAAGDSGCECKDDETCSLASDECQSNRCVQPTCRRGERGCACMGGSAGDDPGLYPCVSKEDECQNTLGGYVCLPKATVQCDGQRGCLCKAGQLCDSGLDCGLGGRCEAPTCVAGEMGCACNPLGYCSEGLQCVSDSCVVPSCDGQLACPCRDAPDTAPIASVDETGGEQVTLACDDNLRCARTAGSGGFCVQGALSEATPKPQVQAPVTGISSASGVSVPIIVLAVVGALLCLLVAVGVIVVMARRDRDTSGSAGGGTIAMSSAAYGTGVRCSICNSLYATDADLNIHMGRKHL